MNPQIEQLKKSLKQDIENRKKAFLFLSEHEQLHDLHIKQIIYGFAGLYADCAIADIVHNHELLSQMGYTCQVVKPNWNSPYYRLTYYQTDCINIEFRLDAFAEVVRVLEEAGLERQKSG